MTRLILSNQTLQLHPEKVIFWEEPSILLVADVHLGKTMHFRKAGIPVPLGAGGNNLLRMTKLIEVLMPQRLIFLGDLFHSFHNEAWEQFGAWRSGFQKLSMDLVLGNHDILPNQQFERFGIKLHDPHLELEPFLFSHEPIEEIIDGKYNLAGHIHPAVRLSGKARQSMRLPCFWFGDHHGLLPAFGNFTGSAIIEPAIEDRVFVISENEVIDVSRSH